FFSPSSSMMLATGKSSKCIGCRRKKSKRKRRGDEIRHEFHESARNDSRTAARLIGDNSCNWCLPGNRHMRDQLQFLQCAGTFPLERGKRRSFTRQTM